MHFPAPVKYSVLGKAPSRQMEVRQAQTATDGTIERLEVVETDQVKEELNGKIKVKSGVEGFRSQ